MARPRSEDKRNAILAAATQVIAEQGVGAPTARIAKLAGVAEGTLFTYFESKDALINTLYLSIKMEMRELMMEGYPARASVEKRARHVWQKYVQWGVNEPEKRRTIAQLGVCDRLSDTTRESGMHAFSDVNRLIQESIKSGVLRNHPPAFIAAILASIAETTMDFIEREPHNADRYSKAGFEAFWNAIARH